MSGEIIEPLLVYTLRAHRGEVSCVDLSGALMATGGGDGTLRSWLWRGGVGWAEAEAVARAHRFGVTATRWAASGSLLASAGVDGAARVWSRKLCIRRALSAPGATAARSLCWASTRLLVGHDDGALCIWTVRSGELMTRLHLCDGSLQALSTLAWSAMLLVACTSGTLKIFNLDDIYEHEASGAELPPPLLWEDGAHDLGALCAATSEGGDWAASGGHDGRIRLWQVGEGRGRGRSVAGGGVLNGHTAAVTSLCWARGEAGEVVASASLDRTARLWAPRTSTCLRVLHAHSRYLTCIALSRDLRFMLTGSNDRSVRTWSIGDFTLDDDIEPSCSVLSHFGLGDLAGIEPVTDENPYEEDLRIGKISGEYDIYNGVGRLWSWKDEQVGAINSIATYKDLLVTACSDGSVRVFRWSEQLQTLSCERVLAAHRYPAMTVDIAADGALLFSAGLDGRGRLWDTLSGCELVSLSGESVGGGEAGGGGVRGARVSSHRPPLLLIATDDGALAVWSAIQRCSEPLHVYEPLPEAATCCAWTSDGRLCAAGGVGAELRLLAPPPMASTLHVQSAAHDLGVLGCDFAPIVNQNESKSYMLGSAGRDALVKIWRILLEGETSGGANVTMCLLWSVEAHGGAVESIRWGSGDDGAVCFATSGADGWARAWRMSAEGRPRVMAAVPAGEGTGATAAALLGEGHLATGTLAGEITLWRLPPTEAQGDEAAGEDAEPRHWRVSGVMRWLREYITRIPGSPFNEESEEVLMRRIREANLTGPRLLDEPMDDLLQLLHPLADSLSVGSINRLVEVTQERDHGVGFEENSGGDVSNELGENMLHARLRDEILWLRRDPPTFEVDSCRARLGRYHCIIRYSAAKQLREAGAPHSLRCPLTHALLREPARAVDGFSYERATILEYFFSAEGAVSPLTGRRLRSSLVVPNIGLRQQLRDYLSTAEQAPG